MSLFEDLLLLTDGELGCLRNALSHLIGVMRGVKPLDPDYLDREQEVRSEAVSVLRQYGLTYERLHHCECYEVERYLWIEYCSVLDALRSRGARA